MKMKKLSLSILPLLGASLSLGLSGCLSSSDSSDGDIQAKTSVISGTVPGTLIMAYGDNGAYYQVASTNDGSDMHPFELELPSGMGYRLVMVTNETAPQEEWIITPIGFYDAAGELQTRFVFEGEQEFDIGHIALQTNYALANCPGVGECVVATYIMDEHAADGSVNPLTLMDADEDGTPDFEDMDNGHMYAEGTEDPMDIDGDGIINRYDDDDDNDGISDDLDDDDNGNGISDDAEGVDSDDDGLPDSVDANPLNDPEDDNRHDDDHDGDGYIDGDDDHDGYLDSDSDHDGYDDNDMDHDGQPDDDSSEDSSDDSSVGESVEGAGTDETPDAPAGSEPVEGAV